MKRIVNPNTPSQKSKSFLGIDARYLSRLGYCLPMVFFCLLFSTNSEAAVKTWTSATGGLWTDGTNWSGTTAPATNDDVVFSNTSNIVVTSVPGITLNSLNVTGTGGVTLQAAGAITIAINNSTGTDDLNVASGSLTMGTNVNINMTAGSNAIIASGATLFIGTGTTLTLTSGATTTATVNGTINVDGTLTINSPAIMTVNGTMNNTANSVSFTSAAT